MSRVETLRALLARVEGAEGADRELDADLVWDLMLPEDSKQVFDGERHVKSGWHILHGKTFAPYLTLFQGYYLTSSVDAALDLLERAAPAWSLHLGMSEGLKHPCVVMGRSYPTNAKVAVEHHTAPLAILAALLHALIAQPTEASHG